MPIIFLLCLTSVSTLKLKNPFDKIENTDFAKVTANAKSELNQFMSLFAEDIDLEVDEGIVLSRLMMEMGIKPVEGATKFGSMSGRASALWHIAAKEEEQRGNKLVNISQFARSIPKIPRSFVEAVNKLDHTKQHNFMFSGSTEQNDLRYRKWLKPFVQKFFTAKDYYRATDAASNPHYKVLGAYDHSKDPNAPHGYRPKDHGQFSAIKYDESYWQAMVNSNFILCPGGDTKWSYRFYETFLTKAIPVIDSIETDWAPKSPSWGSDKTTEINKLGFEYQMTKNFNQGTAQYDPQVAERNYKKFMKYLTWIEGDNVPEGWKA